MQAGQDPLRIEHQTKLGRFRLKEKTKSLHVHLPSLEERPSVCVGIRRINPPDRVGREACLNFVASEGIERAGEEDTAEVKKHDLYVGRHG